MKINIIIRQVFPTRPVRVFVMRFSRAGAIFLGFPHSHSCFFYSVLLLLYISFNLFFLVLCSRRGRRNMQMCAEFMQIFQRKDAPVTDVCIRFYIS